LNFVVIVVSFEVRASVAQPAQGVAVKGDCKGWRAARCRCLQPAVAPEYAANALPLRERSPGADP